MTEGLVLVVRDTRETKRFFNSTRGKLELWRRALPTLLAIRVSVGVWGD